MKTLILLIIATFSLLGFTRSARTIRLDGHKTEIVRVLAGHTTVLNFPSRPTKVVVGNKGLFAVEYVEADLAITALRSGARSNLFVYLEGRRFGFDLVTVSDGGDEIVVVRDAGETKISVKPKVTYE